MKYFVCSDVHSFYTLLINNLKEKGFQLDNPNHILILCGDAMDRGPESVEMLDFLENMNNQKRLIFIRGNHEDLFLECLKELTTYRVIIHSHHYSNGTVKTIADLTRPKDLRVATLIERGWALTTDEVKLVEKQCKRFKKLIKSCIPYYELGDYIFVHGWIPVSSKSINLYHGYEESTYLNDWRNLGLNSKKWEKCRWLNGMDQWRQGVIEPNKTIVCGHWHCSWYWSHIIGDRKEFPSKEDEGWEKSFEMVQDKGIIALDACTAYSELINILVISEEGKKVKEE